MTSVDESTVPLLSPHSGRRLHEDGAEDEDIALPVFWVGENDEDDDAKSTAGGLLPENEETSDIMRQKNTFCE